MEDNLIIALNNLASTLKQIIDYHIPENHPDYELAMSEIKSAKEVIESHLENNNGRNIHLQEL